MMIEEEVRMRPPPPRGFFISVPSKKLLILKRDFCTVSFFVFTCKGGRKGTAMRDKVTLLARVREIRDGKLSFVFERVETHKKGKPIQPKEPENATAYYLRYTEGGKRITKPTGQNFTEAVTACRNK